jgi:hypothetical protein
MILGWVVGRNGWLTESLSFKTRISAAQKLHTQKQVYQKYMYSVHEHIHVQDFPQKRGSDAAATNYR